MKRGFEHWESGNVGIEKMYCHSPSEQLHLKFSHSLQEEDEEEDDDDVKVIYDSRHYSAFFVASTELNSLFSLVNRIRTATFSISKLKLRCCFPSVREHRSPWEKNVTLLCLSIYISQHLIHIMLEEVFPIVWSSGDDTVFSICSYLVLKGFQQIGRSIQLSTNLIWNSNLFKYTRREGERARNWSAINVDCNT